MAHVQLSRVSYHLVKNYEYLEMLLAGLVWSTYFIENVLLRNVWTARISTQ